MRRDVYKRQVFMERVPLFPRGTEVNLSDGRKGLIYENKGPHNLRPVSYTHLDVYKRQDVEQKALSLSCEEVGRILFERTEPEKLVDIEPVSYTHLAAEWYCNQRDRN